MRSIAPSRRSKPTWRNILPLWKLAVPAEFETFYPWDFSKFGRGERFVNAPLPREEFDDGVRQVERWGLDDFVKTRSADELSYSS